MSRAIFAELCSCFFYDSPGNKVLPKFLSDSRRKVFPEEIRGRPRWPGKTFARQIVTDRARECPRAKSPMTRKTPRTNINKRPRKIVRDIPDDRGCPDDPTNKHQQTHPRTDHLSRILFRDMCPRHNTSWIIQVHPRGKCLLDLSRIHSSSRLSRPSHTNQQTGEIERSRK